MFGVRLSKMGSASKLGLIAKAIAILRSYGADAHIYLPGVGTVNGITAGNYLDSAGVTAATVDNPVGLVVDSFGAINATQATTANKPILRRGLLNLRTYSQDFSNAAWAKNSITLGTAQAPDGTSTATKLAVSSGFTGSGFVQGSYAKPATALAFTAACKVKSAEKSWAAVQVSSAYGYSYKYISLSDGSVGSGANTTISSLSVTTLLVDGWVEVAAAATSDTSTDIKVSIFPAVSDGVSSYTGNGTNGIIVYRAGLFQGTYTAQQIIDAGGIPLTTTAAASNPSAGKYSWQFDGSNDSLSLSAPLFQMSDDYFVVAGVRIDTATTILGIVFPSANGNSYAGAITTTGAGTLIFGSRNDALTYFNSVSGTYSIGETFVVSGVQQSGSAKGRKNAGAWGTPVSPTGAMVPTTGVFGGLGPFNSFQGGLYPVIIGKGVITPSDLLTLERFVGQLSGVTGI